MKTMKTTRTALEISLAPLVLTGLAMAPDAWADTILAQTTFVNGSEATSDSFVAPTAGKVTVTLTDLDFSSKLSALSFTANSATQVLASFNSSNATSEQFSFNVGPGSYFANIMATAGGSQEQMHLGLYSLNMTFSPVPLPSSGWLLLTGAFALFGLARAVRPLELMGTAEA